MRAWLRYALPILPMCALVLASCSHVRVVSESAVADSLVADLTLEFFWNLVGLQVRDPSVAPRLLKTNPANPSEVLQSLEAGFGPYLQQLAQAAQVRPVVLFLPHGADPAEAARLRGLTIAPWPETAPPALLSGPAVDTLILFRPLAGSREGSRRGNVEVHAQIASAAGLTGLFFAPSPSRVDEVSLQLYQVDPMNWKQSTDFEHKLCRKDPAPGLQLITKLTYKGGVTDSQTTSLTDKNWGPCTLLPDSNLRGITVKQRGRTQPGRPAIIAGSYFLDRTRGPGPLLTYWIRVK